MFFGGNVFWGECFLGGMFFGGDVFLEEGFLDDNEIFPHESSPKIENIPNYFSEIRELPAYLTSDPSLTEHDLR